MDNNQDPPHLISAGFIIAFAGLAQLIGLGMYGLSDVRNTWDFLVPLITFAQLVVAIFVYAYKKWALITYSIFLLVLYCYIYYFYRDDVVVALKTIGALSLPFILISYIWLFKRDRFK